MKTKNFFRTLCLGFVLTFLGCTEENNYYTTAEGLGKVNVYISGNISNTEAQAKLLAEIGTQTENIYVQNTTQLTSIDIQGVNTGIIGIYITDNIKLTNILIKKIPKVYNFKLSKTYNTELNPMVLVCDDLEEITNNFYVDYIGTGHNITFNHLKKIKGALSESYFSLKNSTYNFPLLELIENIKLGNLSSIISFPSVKQIDRLQIDYNCNFQELNFPNLLSCENFSIPHFINNYSVNMPALIYMKYFYICSYSSDFTNFWLNKFLTINPSSGKTIEFIDSPPPTGQGITNMQTLITNNNTVTFY